MKQTLYVLAAAICGTLAFGSSVHALDGTKRLLCRATEATQCIPGGTCQKSAEVEEFDLPPVLTIDVPRRVVMSTTEGGGIEAAVIQTVIREAGTVMIQGMEAGFAWSVVIGEESGDMSISVSEQQMGLIAYGKCEEF